MRRRGYRCFKLKILGKDNAADAARTVEVYRALEAFWGGASIPPVHARCEYRVADPF